MSCSMQRFSGRWGRATGSKIVGSSVPCAFALGALVGGCQVHGNARLEVGQSLRLPATNLEPLAQGASAARHGSDASGDGAIVAAAGSSLRPTPTSLDRSDWALREFQVPYDGVRHYPSHTRQFVPEYARRSTGRSPSLLSALDLGDASYGMGVAEGVGNLGVALFDAIVLVPEHVLIDPFWQENQSPQWAGERVPMRSWVGEVLSADIPPGQSLEIMRARPARADLTQEIDEPPIEDAEETDAGADEVAAGEIESPGQNDPATREDDDATTIGGPGPGGS